jgi:hypothetical protein
MPLSSEQKAEIERLASLLATARVIRHRFNTGAYNVPGATKELCEKRINKAHEALRQYLDSIE